MRHVLAAINADPCARPVLDAASALAELFDATTVALHVRETGVGSPTELTDVAGVELREVGGEPIEQIVAAADEGEIAAVVLGSRGAQAGPRPAGHTALEVIKRVAKPVTIVPPHARTPKRFARLLVPLEGAKESSEAVDDTIALAHRHKLEIVVLHVHSPSTMPAFSDHEPHGTQAWDQEFLARHLAATHEHVRLLRHFGVAADDVVAVAEEAAADLIVLAWSQMLGEGRAHVVSETIAHSSLPILLLPVRVGPRRPARATR